MAEFVQTMKDWMRMCESFKSCVDCPMYNEDEWAHTLCSEGGISSAKPEVAETVVAKWAAEHPEPVCPTWAEWLHDNGIILDARQHDETEHWILGIEAMKPIPADIAQKLGIEPKEG